MRHLPPSMAHRVRMPPPHRVPQLPQTAGAAAVLGRLLLHRLSASSPARPSADAAHANCAVMPHYGNAAMLDV